MTLRIVALLFPLALACTVKDDPQQTTTTNGVDTSGGSDGVELGCAFPEVQDTTDGMSNPIMDKWSSACTTDAECVALLGAGGVCLFEAVVFELPGGFCTKKCELPDAATRVVMDDPMCDPAGGVACVGQKGQFQNCAVLCTDDAQCNRDGYICRQMPFISEPEDPSLCLMPDCCQETCNDPGD